jgi:DHA3 family macrolide efflux protein-like MFS transporter
VADTARGVVGWLPPRRLLVVHTWINTVAFGAFGIAIVWITLALTHSPLDTGVAGAVLLLPSLSGFLIGAWIDAAARHRRLLAGAMALLRAGSTLALVLALIVPSGPEQLAILYGATAPVGLASAFLYAVRMFWLRQYVPEAELKRVYSYMNVAISLGIVGGVLVPALLFTTAGLRFTIEAIALLFVAVVPTVALMPRPTHQEPKALETAPTSLVTGGLRFFVESTALFQILIANFAYNIVFGMETILAAFLVQQVLRLTAIFLAWLVLAFIGGNIVGSLLGGRYRGRLGFLIPSLYAVAGALFVSVSFLLTFEYVVVAFACVGFALGYVNVPFQAAFLRSVPTEKMGRVQGVFSSLGPVSSALAATSAGFLLSFLTIGRVFALVGLGAFAFALIAITFRELSRLEVA